MTPLDQARLVLRSQPFSVLVGATIEAFAEGRAELRLPVSDALRQQSGFVHGGVVSYLADNALTFAGGGALGPGVITGEFKISYLRPALGGTLVARAETVHAGSRQAVCRCDIHVLAADGSEKLVAVALGTIIRAGAAPGAATA